MYFVFTVNPLISDLKMDDSDSGLKEKFYFLDLHDLKHLKLFITEGCLFPLIYAQ